MRFKALYEYSDASSDTSLTLAEGDFITCTEPANEGWLYGVNERTKLQGYLPETYVEQVAESKAAPKIPPPRNSPSGDATTGRGGNASPNAPKLATKSTLAAPKKSVGSSTEQILAASATSNDVKLSMVGERSTGTKKDFKRENQSLKLKRQESMKKLSQEQKNPANTKYGMYAGNIAVYNGMLTFVCGLVLEIWLGYGVDNWFQKGGLATPKTLAIGIIAMVFGLGISFFEEFYGGHRKADRFPKRSILYLTLAGVLFSELPTIFPAIIWVIVVIFEYIAWYQREEFKQEVVTESTDQYGESLEKWERLKQTIGGRNPEGRTGRLFILVVYLVSILIIGIIWAQDAARAIDSETNIDLRMSNWIPFAKFFGGIMNLNFTLIFIPVAHRVIKFIISNSTDQTALATTLRAVLFFFPFDQAIKFHKLLGISGFIFALLHTFGHLLNFGLKQQLVWDTYGASVWVTGTLLLIVLILMIPATHQNIKRGQFEIFWFTHNLWPVFAALCFFHGNNWWGPNYWKFFLFPGGLYVLERIYREVSRRVPARLKSVTIMDNPKVCSLAFCKAGPFEPLMQNGVEVPAHREGQYAYICCPHVSEFEWHPMTISAAPHEEYVTFHIRVQGPKSWTAQMTQYMMDLAGNAVYKEHSELNGKKEGRTLGIDGKPLFLIDGPHSAPTQHLTQYQDVMVCATGIGITPLAATLKSVVHGIWPRSSGMAYPSNANFYWVCSYQDVPSFKWFLRTIREVCDAHAHMVDKDQFVGKHLGIHIFLTSYDSAVKAGKLRADDLFLPDGEDPDEDVAFWGRARPEEKGVRSAKAGFTEADLWAALTRPENKEEKFGPVTIYNGRPDWKRSFSEVRAFSTFKDVGVMFCGNPAVGSELKDLCDQFTTKALSEQKGPRFLLHKEVF